MSRAPLALAALPILAALGEGCSPAPAPRADVAIRDSGAVPPEPVWQPPGARPPQVFPISAVWPATGVYIRTPTGEQYNVLFPVDWPSVLIGERRIYEVDDPFVSDMLASLRALRGGAGIHTPSVQEAIRMVSMARVVMDPDWSDLTVVAIGRTSSAGYSVTFRKHGVALVGGVGRITLHDYRSDYAHATVASIENRHYDNPAFAALLQSACLAPGVDAKMRDQIFALLRMAASTTPGPDERLPIAGG